MFRRILVPLDGLGRGEQGVSIAVRIGRGSGGSVMLLHVLMATRELGPYLGQSALQHEVIDAAIADATTYLSKAAQAHSLAGVETKVALLSGPEALTILNTAKEQQSDLIIIASHGAPGCKRWALGSVTQKVARESPVPVLVLRDRGTVPSSAYPDKTRPLHTVAAVVALDDSQLAEAAILPAANLVAALAAPATGSLHLTRVVQRPSVDAILSGRARMDPQQRDQTSSEAIEYLCKRADDLRASLGVDLNLAITSSMALDTTVANHITRAPQPGGVA